MNKYFIIAAMFTLAACGSGPYNLTADEQARAANAARDFADRSESKFLSCSGLDSDRDGYVTCSLKDNKTSNITPILCSFAVSGGCKIK